MSQYKVKKLDHPIHCTVEVPGSKSITNRALLMAALSQGECPLKEFCSVTIRDIFF